MEDWLSKAVDTFPELAEQLEPAEIDPMAFWIELRLALDKAYQCAPINEDLIGRIYGYASWCFDQPETSSADTDLGTAVVVCFIEHLPETHAVAADLYRWMSVETFEGFESVSGTTYLKSNTRHFAMNSSVRSEVGPALRFYKAWTSDFIP